MPEMRRSQRRVTSENAASSKPRLSLANDPFLNSPEFSTNLYSSSSYQPPRSHAHQTRFSDRNSFATSSNAMDVDRAHYMHMSPHSSDDESMSDEETSTIANGASSSTPGQRRRYTKRQEGTSYAKPRPESETKVLRNREAAQQFRQRQREHILVLQAEHDRLLAENRAYQEHMSRLRTQKDDLDRDINYARSFLEHTMSIAMANLRHTNRLDQLEPVLARA